MKTALITGINGQDGSYPAELLLSHGYEVHGIVRRKAIEDPEHRLVNLGHLIDKLHLHAGSVDNHLSIYKIVAQVRPDECYHLAASSFVSYTFDDEASVVANNFTATHALLASIKELAPQCRVYLAGSSEMFGDAKKSSQSEITPLIPDQFTEYRNWRHFIWRVIIATITNYLWRPEFFTIVSHHVAVFNLSPEKLVARSQKSILVWPII